MAEEIPQVGGELPRPGAARERRWEPCEIWQRRGTRPDRRAVKLHQGRTKFSEIMER